MTFSFRTALHATAVVGLTSLAACGERSGAPKSATGGTVIIAAPADAATFFPPLISSEPANEVVDALFDRLADPDSTLQVADPSHFRPVLARSWDFAPDSMSIAFHLDPKARWHDGQPVRASDVRFTFAIYRDPAVGSSVASLLGNIDSVTVRDSLTAVVSFKRRSAYQLFDATYQIRILPEHLWQSVPRADIRKADLARAPVGSGRFRFSRWTPGTSIEIVSDTANYRGRAKLDRVIWTVAVDPQARAARLTTGEADLTTDLRLQQLAELSKHPSLRALAMPPIAMMYLMFDFQAPKPLNGAGKTVFSDLATRRALSLAVDRARLTRSVVDSLGVPAIAAVPRFSLDGDTSLTQVGYDPAAARRLLDSLGWKVATGDSVRQRGAERLRFSLLIPSSSATRGRIAILLKDMLRQVGCEIDVEAVEPAVWSQRMADHRFDATLISVSYDPGPSSVRQLWASEAARGQGATNYGAYENPALDALLDSAERARGAASVRQLYHRAYQRLSDDAAGIWLYEPRNIIGLHRRIRPVGIRADAWWGGLADWTIDPAARIPRDDRAQQQGSR